MNKTIRYALFLGLMAPAVTFADIPASSSSSNCAHRVRAIDDQADLDVRDANQQIARLRRLIASTAESGGDAARDTQIRTELAAAEARRADTLRDQHSDLNDVRRQCDVLRDAERQADRDAESSAAQR